MRSAKRTICTLIMAAFLLAMLSTSVFATESGNVWLNVTETDEGNTLVAIVADEAVTDGFVEVYYVDSLDYIDVKIVSECVDVYSVNTDEVGKVKIAWVSAGNYVPEETGKILINVIFSGTAEEAPTMSGELNNAEGVALTIGQTVKEVVDKSELTKAVLAAQGLKAENYTEESFAAVEEALTHGLAVLENDLATVKMVEEATKALNDAMDALVLVDTSGDAAVNTDTLKKLVLKAEGLQKIMYSADSFAALESALANGREVLANAEATQEQVDAAAEALRSAIDALVLISGEAPDTGNQFMTVPMVLLFGLSGAGILSVAIVLISKKGRCAK